MKVLIQKVILKFTRILICIAILSSLYSYAPPNTSAGLSYPEIHGLITGTIDENKDVQGGSNKIEVVGNNMPPTLYGLSISSVNINGNFVGKVASFSDLNENADRGWAYVSAVGVESDAVKWVERFGGNPGYVLSGSTIYSATIKHGDITEPLGQYKAYNLAEIAAASGGRGTTNGTWVDLGNGEYQMVADFQSSPRPEAWLSTDKSVYNVKEKVKVTVGGKDHSYYDKGFIVSTIQVINKTTGTGWKKLIADNTVIDGTGTPVDEPYLWNQTFEYTDTLQPGHYEVYLTLTDRHRRTVEGSPSIGIPKTIITEFDVNPALTCDKDTSFIVSIAGEADVTLRHNGSGTYNLPTNKNTLSSIKVVDTNTNQPIGGTLSVGGQKITSNDGMFSNVLISGPSTTISFESTDQHYCISYEFSVTTSSGGGGTCNSFDVVMDVQIDKDDDISTVTLASGGSREFDERKFNSADIFSPLTGDFFYKIGGDPTVNEGYAPGEDAANTNKYLNIPVSRSTPVHIKFVSSSGAKCWVYTFKLVDTTEQRDEPCPKVYQIIDIGIDPTKEISNGATIDVHLNGSIQMVSSYNSNDGDKLPAEVKWELEYIPDGTTVSVTGDDVQTDRISIPSVDHYGTFNRVGQYKLRHIYDGTIWEGRCGWEITINVTGANCDDITVEAVSSEGNKHYTGSGTYSDPYTSSIEPGDSIWTTIQAHYQGTLIPTTSWEISGGEITTPIAEYGGRFQRNFYNFDPPRMYTIKATIHYQGLVCEKIIYIRITPYNCDQASVSVKVNNTPKSMDNNTLRLVLGQQPSYTVDFRALVSDSISGVTGDWVLKKNGSTGSYTSNGSNTFNHTFTDMTPGTYTVTVKVKKDSLVCDKTLTIVLEGIQCSDLRIHYYDSVDRNWKTNTADTTWKITVNSANPIDWKLVVTDSTKEPGEGGVAVKVIWTADLTNHSATQSTEYARNGTRNGVYKVKAEVNDPNFQNLTNCEFNVEVEILDELGCGTMYLWVFDSSNLAGKQYPNNSEITLRVPAGGKVQELGVLISISPVNPYTRIISSDWTGTKPNQSGGPEAYYITNVGKGTYTITAVTNNVGFPEGCRYEITIIVEEQGGSTDPGGGCTTCEPGGTIDGGKMKLRVYDSENRLLSGLDDGVWEGEPARIEVEIDQNKIVTAFDQVNAQINQAIQKKIDEWEQKYSDPKYEDVQVTATPSSWSALNNAQTKWPGHVLLQVGGPGGNTEYQLNPKTPLQSKTFTETRIPTQTTWRADLHAQNYLAAVVGFQVETAYSVSFDIQYQECEMVSPGEDEEGNPLPEEKVCKPANDSDEIKNTYTIVVKGDETGFEVFEPNATSLLTHTAEWLEYHSRDRYKQSQPSDFYAGERMLTRVHLDSRHRHPVSGKYPAIQGAKAWIYETGKSGGALQSVLSLVPESTLLWKGASRNVPKLGIREEGVDTPLMGDKQKGFMKGGHYAVYFQVDFAYGVTKGFAFPNKSSSTGHQDSEYKRLFRVIANAWERQGIRNHTKQ